MNINEKYITSKSKGELIQDVIALSDVIESLCLNIQEDMSFVTPLVQSARRAVGLRTQTES